MPRGDSIYHTHGDCKSGEEAAPKTGRGDLTSLHLTPPSPQLLFPVIKIPSSYGVSCLIPGTPLVVSSHLDGCGKGGGNSEEAEPETPSHQRRAGVPRRFLPVLGKRARWLGSGSVPVSYHTAWPSVCWWWGRPGAPPGSLSGPAKRAEKGTEEGWKPRYLQLPTECAGPVITRSTQEA